MTDTELAADTGTVTLPYSVHRRLTPDEKLTFTDTLEAVGLAPVYTPATADDLALTTLDDLDPATTHVDRARYLAESVLLAAASVDVQSAYQAARRRYNGWLPTAENTVSTSG